MRVINLIEKMLCTILMVQSISVSAQSIRYSTFYDSNQGAEILKEAVPLDNGSLLLTGSTSNSNATGLARSFNVVVSDDGTLEHSHVREMVESHIVPKALARSNNTGGIYEAGYICDVSDSNSGYCSFYLAKLDETGDTIFTRTYARPDTSDYLLDIVQTRHNKLMLIGWTYNDTTSTDADLMFITIDTLGNEVNRVVWGGAETDYVHSGLVINEDGEVLMTGYTRSFPSLNSTGRTWILKTDSIGNVLWHREYSGVFGIGSSCTRICSLADGNFLAAGGNQSFGNSSFGVDGALLKIDPLGNQIWAKEYEVPEGQGLWDCKGLADGTIVSCGVTVGDDGSQAGWLIKTDAEGDTLWTRTYNPSSLIDFIRFMLLMPNGDIVMLGDGRAPGQTNQDGWILRVDSMGCLVEGCFSVGIDDRTIDDERFAIFPNPASDVVNVKVQGFKFKVQSVVVTDALGRTSSPPAKEGLGEVLQLNTTHLPNGIYLLTITDHDGNRYTERLVVQH